MDFLKQNAATQPQFPTHNVSELGTQQPSKPQHGKTKDDSVANRYYTSQEYKNLTQGQKQALKRKREFRNGGSAPRKQTRFEPAWKKDMKVMNRNISALLAAAAVVPDRKDPDEDDSDGDRPTPAALPGGNRTNDALTRQRHGKTD
jgi:hypothetical protein